MKTLRLFKDDVYMREAEARVTALSERNGKALLCLDRTLFFPTGGGQSCDSGTINAFPVTDVYEYEDEIFHELDFSSAQSSSIPSVGDTVHLSLDWARRFDNMQRHCGEHILSGIFYREWGGINRGFHMGEDYMTIDIAFEDGAGADTLTWEMCLEAERMTNELITADLPMLTRHFDSYEEAAGEPMRKKLTIESDITLVGIGKPEYDWGCVACCGTHPSTTGQVGMLKIFKLESNKGMYRIYFEAGRRAFEKYQQQLEVLNELCDKLSAGSEDVLEKFRILQEKNKEIRNQLHFLKKDILAKEAASILDELLLSEKSPSTGSSGSVRRYELLSLDDLVALSREISPAIKKIFFLVHEPSNTVLLVSNGKTDCGRLVKENASIYNGRGGGSSTMARAIFGKEEYVDTFIDLIEKHLR